MKNIELSGLKGEFEVKLYGPNGLLKDYRKVKNTTVLVGFQAVCTMMGNGYADRTIGAFDECAIGTGGATAASTNDTTLLLEIARQTGGYTASSTIVWRNDATFGAGTGTGAINESGLLQGASGACTMLCRQTFAVINKGASDTLVVTWQYTLS